MTLAGNVIVAADLDLSDTCWALKEQVYESSGLVPSFQNLISDDTVLSDFVTMSELGFRAGTEATLFLVSGLTSCTYCGRKFAKERIEMHIYTQRVTRFKYDFDLRMNYALLQGVNIYFN